MKEEHKESHLKKAADHASKAADLADKASDEAQEAVDQVRQVEKEKTPSGRGSSDPTDSARDTPESRRRPDSESSIDPPDNSGGSPIDPPDNAGLPGDPSVTRPDY